MKKTAIAQDYTRQPTQAATLNKRVVNRRIARECATDSALAAYLRDLNAYPTLDRARERALAQTLRAGNPVATGASGPMTREAHAARDELITGNLRLALSVAALYAEQGVPLIDVVQAANIGLIRAVDRYEPGRARLSTHAVWWIREACSRYVMAHAGLIRLPRNVSETRRKIHRLGLDVNGDTEEARKLAAQAGMTPAQIHVALNAPEQLVSLATPLSDDGDVTLLDTIPDQRAEDLSETVARNDLIEGLYEKLASVLTPRERVVIAMRYGLGALAGAVAEYADIGRTVGVTERRVRMIEQEALNKLRAAYRLDDTPDGALRQLHMRFPSAHEQAGQQQRDDSAVS